MANSSFEFLKVIQVIDETPEAYTIQFEAPEGWLNYLPGQYLTLKVNADGQWVRRAYSLSSSPATDKFLAVTIKAVPDGLVSNYLKLHIHAGDAIEALAPNGNFVAKLDPEQAKHYILIGAGSGITPLMSILKSVLATERDSVISLIYGNRNEKSIIFQEQLQHLFEHDPDKLNIYHCLSNPTTHQWDGPVGRIEGENAEALIQQAIDRSSLEPAFFICGPSLMMESVQQALQRLGIKPESIHQEFYSAPIRQTDDESNDDFEIDYEVITRDVQVILNGNTYSISVTPESNILQAAIDAGLDPPYACQEGICSTCRGRVHSGMVQMMIRDGLSDEEIESNYVLTCQCNPLTDDVVVEFA